MKSYSHASPISLLLLALCSPVGLPRAAAEVSLPAIFSDHMVLQRDMAVPIWGWAKPDEQVTVSIGTESKSTKADANGKWKLVLGKMAAGPPTSLSVKGHNTLTINDVLLGDVWLCAGQFNMEMKVSAANNADQEKAAANFPAIRMFTVRSGPAIEPQEKCEGQWVVCTPEAVGAFSAAAYFFGRELHTALNALPIGLIHASVGGTPIEAWTSEAAMKDQADLKPIQEIWEKATAAYNSPENVAKFEADTLVWKQAVEQAKAANKPAPRGPKREGRPRVDAHHPANLFNGKIAPLIPYGLRGTILYQGESNAEGGTLYGQQLPLLINDWRNRWGQGDLPFAWVQLPNFRARTHQPVETASWAEIRESMLKTLALPNTGMTISLDIGEEKNLHPKNKQEIGRRLALWALATVYGKDLPYSGPLYDKLEIKADQAVLSFKHANGGLIAKNGELKGFAIAGADKKWVWASARVEGGRVWVSSPEVKEPVAVRYCWANNPEGTLANGAQLPASPFRTDNW